MVGSNEYLSDYPIKNPITDIPFTSSEPIGRVIFKYIGAYDSSYLYSKLDVVDFNEEAFVAKQSNLNMAPSNGQSNEYWQLLSKKSEMTWPLIKDGIISWPSKI